jgi:hypothetical protein
LKEVSKGIIPKIIPQDYLGEFLGIFLNWNGDGQITGMLATRVQISAAPLKFYLSHKKGEI